MSYDRLILDESNTLALRPVQAARRKVAEGCRLEKGVNANGDTIPIRGGNASEFWSKLQDGE
jgi:hypothetical protein